MAREIRPGLELPELRRRAVVHSYLDGFTAEDIAYLLEISADDVACEVASGVKALRLDLASQV